MRIFNLIQLFSITVIFTAGSVSFGAEPAAASLSKFRLEHAKELLGKQYAKTVTKKGESETDVTEFVKETTKRFLDKKDKKLASKISKAILEASNTYELDPLFLMAVIQNESSFSPKMKGSAGEIGLMQIKPSTAQWISKLYKLKYKNSKSLYDPATNIALGAALVDKLRDQFDSHSRLYLSAYNIGAKKVRTKVTENKTPKIYVQAVMKRYLAFYAGFKVTGDSKEQSEMAWNKTVSLTER